MNEAAAPLLLDTCAIIFLAEGQKVRSGALARIDVARRAGAVFVSPISAWEIGLLSRSNRPQRLRFDPDPRTWFSAVLAEPGIRLAAFDWQIALAPSALPDGLHKDPIDRLLVATARHMGAALVTRDRPIVAYAEAGHVAAIAC